MKMADVVNQRTEEFKNILKAGVFNKNDIEEFLKSGIVCSDACMSLITDYVCKKYKNEIRTKPTHNQRLLLFHDNFDVFTIKILLFREVHYVCYAYC